MLLQIFKKIALVSVLFFVSVPLVGSEAAARRRGKSGRLSRAKRKARKKARVLVKKGVAKLREGDYVAALELFTDAFKIYPSPKIQFNIGQTYKELGRYLDAIGAYEKFLADTRADASTALRKLATDNIRELFRKIAIVRVKVSVEGAAISVDGRPRGISPLAKPLRLMPGAHSLVVKKEGFITAVVNLRLAPGNEMLRKVTLHRPRPKVVQVIWKTLRKPKKGLNVLWAGIAVTGATALAAAITGAMSLVEQQKFDDLDLPLAERRAAGDRGKRYQLATDGLLIGAAVVAVSTLIWYLTYVRPSGGTERVRVRPDEKAMSPRLHLAPGAGGLSFSF